jgi:dCMP deaminase
MVVHADHNALPYAGRRAEGGSIYIVGKPICARCAVLVIQSGIKRVVARKPKDGTTSHWDKSGKTALEMFDEAGVLFLDSTKYNTKEVEPDQFSILDILHTVLEISPEPKPKNAA